MVTVLFYGFWGLTFIILFMYFAFDAARGSKDIGPYPTGILAVKDISKSLIKILLGVAIISGLIGGAIEWRRRENKKLVEQANLQQDAPTIAVARQAIAYLDSYYKTNYRYPNSQEFYQTFGHQGELSYDWATNVTGQMTDQTFVLTYILRGHHKEAVGQQCDQPGIFGGGTPRYCIDNNNYKQFLYQN